MPFATERERKFKSELVNKLSWTWIIINAVVMAAGIIIYTPASFTRWITNILIVTGIGLASLALNHFSYTKMAAYVLPGCMFLHITHLAYTGGGTNLPGILNFIPIVLTTGFLLGREKGIIMAVLCVATTFGIALLETNGLLPVVNFVRSPVGRAIALILPVSIATAIQYFATGHMSAALAALQSEIAKREEAERLKDQTVYNLGERVKELKTLYTVSHILQGKDGPSEKMFCEIAEALPPGWQYPDITAARLCIAGIEYTSHNYRPSEFYQRAEMKTQNETKVEIEIVYLKSMPELDEGPFLREERNLINMVVEILKIDLERRERRAELKDYKYALDIASGISISGEDGNFTFVNENFCKATKYSPEELLGQQHSILWSGYHSPEYFDELGIAMQDGKPYRGEFCNKAKDGSLYWVDTSIVPFLDENGKVYQYLSINYDITERRMAEEKLKRSEEMQRAMIENMTDGLILLDSDLSFVYQSPSVERITGYSLEERNSKEVNELVYPDDIEILKKSTEQVINNPNQSINFQVRILHKSGRIVWLDGTLVNLLNNPDIGAVMVHYSDITEHKEAEEKIKQSEQLLKKVTSQVPGNTYMFEIEKNGNNNILFSNRGTDSFNHSYDLDDLAKTPEKMREIVHIDDKTKFNEAMKAAYQTQSIISFQYRIVVNEHIRWRWMQAIPEKNTNGKIVWYGATSDITPLVDYIASIEQVIFDIGHVIRRPISSMMGMTRLIIDEELSEQEIKEISQKLYLISDEMDKFIRELNLAYHQKRQDTKLNIDISSFIDKRDSLFN